MSTTLQSISNQSGQRSAFPPVIPARLAQAMDLLIAKGVEKEYHSFRIPKRKGGFRTINAPSHRLKTVQKRLLAWMNRWMPSNLPAYEFSHGFKKKHSIVSNALVHSGMHFGSQVYKTVLNRQFAFASPTWTTKETIINNAPVSAVKLDIRGAFDNVGWQLLKHHWPKFITPEDTNRILGVCLLDGVLPQGAPTSPFLLNVGLGPVDMLIWKVIRKRFDDTGMLYNYSRYADDIVISSRSKEIPAKHFIKIVEGVTKYFGLSIKKSKTRIMTRSTGLFITGVNIVNGSEHISISRKSRDKIRAEIYNTKAYSHTLSAQTIGKICHVLSLDTVHGARLLEHALKHELVNKTDKIIGRRIDAWIAQGQHERSARVKLYNS